MAFDQKQRGVLGGIACGLAVTLGGIGAALWAGSGGLIVHGGVSSRLVFWTVWALPVLATLIVAVGTLGRHRFLNAEDIDGGGLGDGTPTARMLQAVLQNTLEQVVLWLGISLVWVVRMPAWGLGVIPVSAILFVIGRVLFRRGYAGGAPARALGFAMTFYPSVAMALILALEIVGLLPGS